MESSDVEASIAGVAIERLVLGCGIPAPSFRAIAREANVTHSTVAEWFGSKDSMLLRCGLEFAQRHRTYLSGVWARHGLEALWSPGVGASDAVRSRSFWVAWARACDGTAAVVHAVHRAERDVLRDALMWGEGMSPSSDEVARVHRVMIGSWDLGIRLVDLPNVRTAT